MTALALPEKMNLERPVRRSLRQVAIATNRHQNRYRYVGADAEFRNLRGQHSGEYSLASVELIAPHELNFVHGRFAEDSSAPALLPRVEAGIRLNWRAAFVILTAFFIQAVIVIQSAGIQALIAISIPMVFAFFYVLLLDVRRRMAAIVE